MIVVIRTTRRLVATTALVGLIAAGTVQPGALASSSAPTGAPALARAARLDSGLVVTTTRTITIVPKVQRTVHFTGYATYTFAARRGRRIVSASARISGAEVNAVTFGRQAISRNHRRYTVSLVFPNEQGNPGRLTVRLETVG
jgi:hypothetical protein